MFFFLSKILYYFLMPLSWVLYLLIYASLTKKLHLRRRLVWIALGTLIFFGNGFIQNEVYRWWEVKPISLHPKQVYDVAIVLTGDIAATNDWLKGRPSFGRGADRLWQALTLYKQGKVKKILISGGTVDMPGIFKGGSESDMAKVFLEQTFQMNPQDLWLESASRNTHENALYSSQMLRKLYPTGGNYLLCTSAFHMRRAQACFHKVGLVTTMYATDLRSTYSAINLDNLIPREQPLYYWQVMFREWIGYCMYKLVGYI